MELIEVKKLSKSIHGKEILKDSSLKNSEKQSRLNKILGLKPSDKQKKAILPYFSSMLQLIKQS